MRDFFLNLVKDRGGFKVLHAHLDKSNLITPKLLYQAQAASMQEKWYLYKHLKDNYTFDDVYSRAEKSLHQFIKQKVPVLRTFVDADTQVGQMCIDAIAKLKEDYRDVIDLEIAIQPLEGLDNSATREAYREACSKADIAGGLPSRDLSGAQHLRILFDIASELGLPVDVHTDQLNSPGERETELLLDIQKECNFKHKVNAVHCISLACQDYEYQHEIAKRLREQDVGVILCPSAALSMKPVTNEKPPHEIYAPVHNSIAPLQVLLQHGVELAMGIDNISDLFMPLVDGDMWFECRLLMEATRCYDLSTIANIATTYR